MIDFWTKNKTKMEKRFDFRFLIFDFGWKIEWTARYTDQYDDLTTLLQLHGRDSDAITFSLTAVYVHITVQNDCSRTIGYHF